MASAFQRLSVVFKTSKAKTIKASESSGSLAEFLLTAKQAYLKAINETPSRGGEWTVVMGNEAGGKYISFSFQRSW
jgi:exopolyphosphatase